MDRRGVLVAGGRGTRLGLSSAKALAVVGGSTLFQRATETLILVSDEVVIAAPESIELPPPSAGARVRRVFDRSNGSGPLAGVVAALEDGAFRSAIVLGVDFPFMRPLLLSAWAERLDREPRLQAIVPAPGGRLQPLAAVYSSAFATALDAAFEAGERSIVRAVERLRPTVVGEEELTGLPGGLENFYNLNTPEDLIEAERRWAVQRVKP